MNFEKDSQLVLRTQSGDLAAFEEIVRRHRTALINAAMHRLDCIDDAEDIAQEAFVQAYFRLHQLREPEALLPWLRRMTDRLALMRLRKKREELLTPEEAEQFTSTRANVLQNIENGAVDELLQKLPETMRETVSLVYIAGYTNAEAANLLGVKEGTIKSRLNRARTILKEAIAMAKREGKTEEEFTQETIERLMREARQLMSHGENNAAAKKAREVLNMQVKKLFESGDDPSIEINEEAAIISGLPYKEQRQKDCEANAAQYGYRLDELDWELDDINVASGTLGRPTGHGQDVWGVPHSKMHLKIMDARDIGNRLLCSPQVLWEWVNKGCPILRCWPFVRFDLDRVKQWLQDNNIIDWPKGNRSDLDRPIRIIFKALHKRELTPEKAEEIITDLGWGVWD